jgi:transposase
MGYWAKAPMGREQIVLFSPTLESMIAEDHPVRLLDEILGRSDWTAWEAKYHGQRGQPPIHPRVLAGVLLYGLSRGVRSSRHLEYLIGNNLDFLWLVEGRHIDHSTLCDFRKDFREPLKGLFRQVCRIAMRMGLIRLNEVALDGTRVKASNDRFETLTATGLQERLAALDAQIEQMLQEAERADAAESKLFDRGTSSQQLPGELGRLKTRQAQLQKALQEVQAADKARRSEGIDPQKNPAQIPTTDVDSKVLPNKEGGYAPN